MVPSFLHNSKESSKNRRSKDEGQHLRFQHIRDEQFRCLLIEAEFLFEHKGVVYTSWQREHLLNDDKCKNEENAVCDFAGKSCGEEAEPGGG